MQLLGHFPRRSFLLGSMAAVQALVLAAVARRLSIIVPRTSRTFPKRVENMRSTTEGPELVLRPSPLEENGVTYRLTGAGPALWELSDGTNSIDDIADAIGERYSVSKRRARFDAIRFVHVLADAGLLLNITPPRPGERA